MTSKIRVLIADDSRTERALLRTLLGEDPRIEVAGEASDGVEAVEMAISLRPTILTIDLQMPRLGGLQAIDRIMEDAPSRILVVCSVTDEHEVDLSFRAVALGALDLIAKPRGEQAADIRKWGRRLCESVCLMSEIPVVRRRRSVFRSELAVSGVPLDAVGIVASTGGPPVLAMLLGSLPSDTGGPAAAGSFIAPPRTCSFTRWPRCTVAARVRGRAHGHGRRRGGGRACHPCRRGRRPRARRSQLRRVRHASRCGPGGRDARARRANAIGDSGVVHAFAPGCVSARLRRPMASFETGPWRHCGGSSLQPSPATKCAVRVTPRNVAEATLPV